jgi:hypothetical protein
MLTSTSSARSLSGLRSLRTKMWLISNLDFSLAESDSYSAFLKVTNLETSVRANWLVDTRVQFHFFAPTAVYRILRFRSTTNRAHHLHLRKSKKKKKLQRNHSNEKHVDSLDKENVLGEKNVLSCREWFTHSKPCWIRLSECTNL